MYHDNMNFPSFSDEVALSNYNIVMLKNLTFEKISQHQLKGNVSQVDKLIMLAAVSVLKDISPYIMGTMQISERHCELIKDEFEKLKDKINANEMQKEMKSSERISTINSMIERIRKRQTDRSDPTKMKELLADYYQVMGCFVSYGHWKKGDRIPGPHPDLPDYQVREIITNKKGLQIVVLAPLDVNENSPPLFCCRGTTSNIHNIIDDMNQHIGQYSFQASSKTVLKTLNEVTKDYGPAVITGHSLGGAIAQIITEEYCDIVNSDSKKPMIKETHLYCSPGAGQEVALKYKNKLKTLNLKDQPQVHEYHHIGDIVVLTGGDHLEANHRMEIGKLSIGGLLSPAEQIHKAHSWSKLISESNNPTTVRDVTFKRRFSRSVVEMTRRSLSAIFMMQMMTKQINEKQKMKREAKKLIDFMKTQSDERKGKILLAHAESVSAKQNKTQEIELVEFPRRNKNEEP
jgi:hypothetical protein